MSESDFMVRVVTVAIAGLVFAGMLAAVFILLGIMEYVSEKWSYKDDMRYMGKRWPDGEFSGSEFRDQRYRHKWIADHTRWASATRPRIRAKHDTIKVVCHHDSPIGLGWP